MLILVVENNGFFYLLTDSFMVVEFVVMTESIDGVCSFFMAPLLTMALKYCPLALLHDAQNPLLSTALL